MYFEYIIDFNLIDFNCIIACIIIVLYTESNVSTFDYHIIVLLFAAPFGHDFALLPCYLLYSRHCLLCTWICLHLYRGSFGNGLLFLEKYLIYLIKQPQLKKSNEKVNKKQCKRDEKLLHFLYFCYFNFELIKLLINRLILKY